MYDANDNIKCTLVLFNKIDPHIFVKKKKKKIVHCEIPVISPGLIQLRSILVSRQKTLLQLSKRYFRQFSVASFN